MFNKKDDKPTPTSDRRTKRERRFNDDTRREEIRWEPEKNPRREIQDRREDNIRWKNDK